MNITVVITTRNEQENIGACLESIFEQRIDVSGVQVIVVDNYSDDLTEQYARQFPCEFYQYGPERNAQRNYGLIEKSSGEILVWIDADMLLHPHLFSEIVREFKSDPEVVALYVPEVILGDSLFSQIRRFERSFYDATPVDGVRAIRAMDFKAVGGFDQTWMHGPDDWDLDLKLQNRGGFGYVQATVFDKRFSDRISAICSSDCESDRVGIYHNESKLSLSKHLRKKIHYSADFEGYLRKWKGHPNLKKQVGLFYRFFQVFFENGKWKKVVRAPHLYLGFLSVKTVVGFCFVINRRLRWGLVR
ncbi:glycosyltransferase family 2 protein [Litoricolaceae bacterium]|nr:glycosyltransferase family 2 protein [Litorivicinaceae bacterium]